MSGMPSWWQAKDHPIWRLAEFGAIALLFAFIGSDSLDIKDYAAVLGGVLYGRVRSGS